MSIVKGRGASGRRQVFSYDAVTRHKRYVGTIGACTGNGNARTCKCQECKAGRKLESEGAERFKIAPVSELSVAEWRTEWLERMHGAKTARSSSTTYKHNTERTSAFLTDFGHRKLASITDDEASDFALEHPGRVKVVKAMFNDAERRGRIEQSPFRHVKAPKSTGRQEIIPLTETELARLAEIAAGKYGQYGRHLSALVTFAGWTGLRPGELCGLEWTEIGAEDLYVWWQRRKDGARVRTKTKLNRNVPLFDRSVQALAGVPRDGGAVFRAQRGQELRPDMLAWYWQDIRDDFTAELAPTHWLPRRLRQDPTDKLTVYEVRHHFGSVLGDQGLSARDIAKVMGNSPAICERVYVHSYESRVQDRVRAALENAAGNLEAPATVSRLGEQVA